MAADPMTIMTEVFHHMAIVPVIAVLLLFARGTPLTLIEWTIAGMFAVEWIADTAAHTINPWLIAAVYPLSQAGLLILYRRAQSMRMLCFLAGLAVIGLAGVWLANSSRPDVFFRSIAWCTIVILAHDELELGELRAVLLFAFGVRLVTWILFVRMRSAFGAMAPVTWIAAWEYQMTGLVSIVAFCVAISRPRAPSLVHGEHHGTATG